MLLEKFEGQKYVGYGCVVTNSKINIQDTVVYKDLQQNFNLNDTEIYIDKVMVNVKKRPILKELIDNLNQYDRIYISNISDLLGTTNKAREYYKLALEKEIELFITDYSHTLFHLHPLSTLIPKNTSNPIKLDVERKLEEFDKYVANYVPPVKAGRKKITVNFYSQEWKKLYFAYESYQLDLENTLQIAKEQFNINNYPTFVSVVNDYEKTLEYHDDTLQYAKKDPYFVELPKRIIKRTKEGFVFPYEYFIIKDFVENQKIAIEFQEGYSTANEIITKYGEEHNFLINSVIFKRYQNLEGKTIPRKLRNDINIEF